MGRDTRSASCKGKDTKVKNDKQHQETPTKKNGQKIKNEIQKDKKQGQKSKNGYASELEGRSMRVRAGVLDKQEVHTICLNNNGTTSSSSEINQPTNQMELEVPITDNCTNINQTNGKISSSKNETKSKKNNSKKKSLKIVDTKQDNYVDENENELAKETILNPEAHHQQISNSSNEYQQQNKQEKSESSNAQNGVNSLQLNGNGAHKGQRNLPKIKGIKESSYSLYINTAQSNGLTYGNENKNNSNNNSSNNSNTIFLGKEDQFKDFSIIVGSFSKQHSIYFGSTFIQEAKMRGFNLEIVYDDKEFISKINSFDIVWIVDSPEFNKKHEQTYIESFKSFFQSKKSLYFHAGPNSSFSRTNLILTHFFNNMTLSGKLKPKEKFVNASDNIFESKVPYTFNQAHCLAYGISSLKLINDQSTLQQKHPDFSNFLVSQNCQPLVLISEENDLHGRIILDCGFLSYDIKFWSSDHFHNYLSNSTVWLTGIPN